MSNDQLQVTGADRGRPGLEATDDWYARLRDDLREIAKKGMRQLVAMKHAIGTRVLRDRERFGKPKYGSHRMETLAKDIGIGFRDLHYCVQFAKKYPTLCTGVAELSWRDIRQGLLPEHCRLTPELPVGKYRVIYADPPWKYGDSGLQQYGHAEVHYPSMSIKELCALDVKGLAADDAVLFMWVTSPLLDECWPVIDAWGFEYKTSFVWDKVKHNYGHYNSVRHELLLVCTRGAYLPETPRLFASVQSIERSNKHSEKPEAFRQIVEELYPTRPWIELFARRATPGWEHWGLEAPQEVPR